MTPEESVERGQRAARLLKDPLLEEAFAMVAQAIHQQWEAAPIRDKEGAHELKLMVKLLGDVRSYIETAVADGKFAADELMRRNKLTPAEFAARYR